MASILCASSVLTLSFVIYTEVWGIEIIDVPLRIDRFLRVEDEVLVSPHRFEENIHTCFLLS